MSQQKVLRIYADGIFDNFHIGHSNMFKQCRQAFPNKKIWLIAGVCAQRDVLMRKGPTISTQRQRFEMVRQCRWVDEVYEGAPWNLTEEFLQQMKIDFVCHDDIPYATIESDDAYEICKKLGKFQPTKRTQGISTTDVIGKILREKDMFYFRNIKRGADRKQLGLSLPVYYYHYIKSLICPHRPKNTQQDQGQKKQK